MTLNSVIQTKQFGSYSQAYAYKSFEQFMNLNIAWEHKFGKHQHLILNLFGELMRHRVVHIMIEFIF